MKITVILCTYNRCEDLALALESLASSLLPTTAWEVLVVDNNSQDKTRETVDAFRGRFPGQFRYLCEKQQGKSHALNSGIHEAKGEILVFTDDDVIVDPTWLENLTSNLSDERWAGAGGRTLPPRNFSPPRWLSLRGRYALAPLAIFDRGPEAGDLLEAPFGNNSAYRRTMFEKHGGFRTDLGPCAGSKDPQKSEDSEFGNRLLLAGERFRYEASAVLYHSVPQNRVQKKYFQDWWFDKARADVQAFGVPHETKWFLAGIPLNLFRRLAVWTLRWLFSIEPGRRFESKLKVWSLAGSIFESYRVSFNTNEGRKRNARP